MRPCAAALVLAALSGGCDPGTSELQGQGSAAVAGGSGGASAASTTVGSGGHAGAAAATFCATQPPGYALCADFDEGAAAISGFSGSQVLEGTIAVDEADAQSLPASVVFETAGSASMLEHAYLTKTPIESAAQLTCSFAIRIESFSEQDGDVLELYWSEHVLGLRKRLGGGAELIEVWPGNSTSYPLATTFADGAWHRVEIDVDLLATPKHARVSVGDPAGPLAVALEHDLDPSWSPSSIAVDLGVVYADADAQATPSRVRVDDVLCTLTPP